MSVNARWPWLYETYSPWRKGRNVSVVVDIEDGGQTAMVRLSRFDIPTTTVRTQCPTAMIDRGGPDGFLGLLEAMAALMGHLVTGSPPAPPPGTP